ncbi:MAG: tandem-95 repeat protein [Thermoplasmata archaeon]|nr:tandem-95 repeat protein [Thermoplasmata archaeon]
MKINSAIIAIFVIMCLSFSTLAISVVADDGNSSYNDGNNAARSDRQNYVAYYNKTFSISSGWEWQNVSVVVFVQTQDQTVKNDVSNNYQFNSAEVLQSTVNDLDGNWVSTTTSRHVLAELFTSEFCGFCPGAVGAMDRIARDSTYYPTKMSLIEWHPNSGGFADQYGFPESDSRISWYFGGHSMGYPTSIFDGDIEDVGGSSDGNSTNIDTRYKNHINGRTAITSPLDITTKGYKDSNSGWINASVELSNPTELKNLEVYFVVVEDIYPEMKGSAYLRYTARSVLTNEDFIPPNHEPVVENPLNPIKILEDMSDSTTINLEHVFMDDDSDDMTFSSDKDGTNKEHIDVTINLDGQVTLTPDADWNGVEDITFYADDGIVTTPTSHQVTVTIDPVNDAPYVDSQMIDFNILEDDVATDKFDLNVVFKDVDIDPDLNAVPQDALTFSYSGNEHISVAIDTGMVSFTPETQWNGVETITFKATDPLESFVTEEVWVTVKPENDVPELISTIDDIEFDEDTVASEIIDMNDYFTDSDGDALLFSYSGNENIYVYIDTLSKVTLTPKDNFKGMETITFYADDSIADPIFTDVKVKVLSVNDAPILNNTEEWEIISKDVRVTRDDTVKIDEGELLNVIVTAYDPADGDALTYSDDTDLFNINSVTGEISVTPDNDDVGTHTVKISVDDGGTVDNIAELDFKFIVENTNNPPDTPVIISPQDQEVFTVGTAVNFKGSCYDIDFDVIDSEEALSFIWSSNLSSENLGYGEELSVSDLRIGVHEITLTVKDNAKDESSTAITITIEVDKVLDTDSDGIPDYRDDDDDNDLIPDTWEDKYNLDPLDPTDADKDSDGDTFSNLEEYLGDDGLPSVPGPGGDDSTNPRSRSSMPEIAVGKDSSSDDDDWTVAIIAVVIVVVIVILLAMFLVMRRKREQKGEAEAPVAEGEDERVPTPAQYGVIPPPPGMEIPPGQLPPLPPPPMQPLQYDMMTTPQPGYAMPPPLIPIPPEQPTPMATAPAPQPPQYQQPMPAPQPPAQPQIPPATPDYTAPLPPAEPAPTQQQPQAPKVKSPEQ